MTPAKTIIVALSGVGIAFGVISTRSVLIAKSTTSVQTLDVDAPVSASDKSNPVFDPKSTLSVAMPLEDAIRDGLVEAAFTGNGRDRMAVALNNKSSNALQLTLDAGRLLRAGRNAVIITRKTTLTAPPKAKTTEYFFTAALSSANLVGPAGYELTPEVQDRLAPFLAHLAKNLEITPGAVQTAILALSENLPLRAFARFAIPGQDIPLRSDTSAFKVDTADIVSALITLREFGIRDDALALTVDPQLRVEAMIDPLAHANAVKYFGIADEWAYWKKELLSGDASTRHYALFGIARFYPDIALKMLPQWARETRTDPVYRVSAVQALAETQRIEALSTLRQLSRDLGNQTEIGKTAHIAADFLETRITQQIVSKIPFRTGIENLKPLPANAAPIPPVLAIIH